MAIDDQGDLVVLDLGLMEEYASSAVETEFVGTKEYALPAYFDNPSIGFDAFQLEIYSLNKTIEWMVEGLNKQDSGYI